MTDRRDYAREIVLEMQRHLAPWLSEPDATVLREVRALLVAAYAAQDRAVAARLRHRARAETDYRNAARLRSAAWVVEELARARLAWAESPIAHGETGRGRQGP